MISGLLVWTFIEIKKNDVENACNSMCQLLGLTNLVKENTFVHNSGQAKSVLDLVLTDSPNLIKKHDY